MCCPCTQIDKLTSESCLKYDFKAFLDAGADTVAESQEQTAREMYRLLSSIPLDHLAANG